MGHRVAAVALAILALIAPVGTPVAARPGRDAQTTAATPPKLVVILVVDQMRADYVNRFQSDWTSGLKRLVTQGAWFSQAAYPYLTTDTCAGHATVATGAFPHVHGIIQNAWWDRESRRQTACTEDPRAFDIGNGAPLRGGDSAHRLQVPTFTDRMRIERAARVVSLSLKDRSAVMLAGHGADAVTWLSSSLDRWMTSSVYAAGPVPAVQEFTESNPIARDYGKTWSRLLPASRYEGPDDGLAEAPPRGWTRTFPHALTGIGDKPDASFLAQWERSPFADAYVGRFATALVESMQLGRHAGTDVLSVSFSSPDLVGHAFGPHSHEVQDMYAHLDRTIGTLIERLDALIGSDGYVVALTSDHGVTPIPEQLVADGRDAGRINAGVINQAIQQQLRATVGADEHGTQVNGNDTDFGLVVATVGGERYVTRVNGNDVYFEPGVYANLRTSPAILDAVVAAIVATPGVQKVFRAEEVRGAVTASDPLLRAAALSYFPGRSGDLILVPKAGWMFSTAGTTHGTVNADNQRVPILFFGRGIKPGRYTEAATPADIAPTLAAICGIAMPAAEGRVLRSALR